MFIIANDADGYGVDRCLASGDKCGSAAANAYCKTQAFAQAATYHKADRSDITGAIPTARWRLPGGQLQRCRYRLHALITHSADFASEDRRHLPGADRAQPCSAAHISRSRSAVQITGHSIPRASS